MKSWSAFVLEWWKAVMGCIGALTLCWFIWFTVGQIEPEEDCCCTPGTAFWPGRSRKEAFSFEAVASTLFSVDALTASRDCAVGKLFGEPETSAWGRIVGPGWWLPEISFAELFSLSPRASIVGLFSFAHRLTDIFACKVGSLQLVQCLVRYIVEIIHIHMMVTKCWATCCSVVCKDHTRCGGGGHHHHRVTTMLINWFHTGAWERVQLSWFVGWCCIIQ